MIVGDILTPNKALSYHPIICHQVNCKGVMGGGLAKQIRDVYPNVYYIYKRKCEAMKRVMDTVGVSKWEDLKGEYVRIKGVEWGNTITCIGNILKDKWFDLKDFFVMTQTRDNY